MITEEQRQLRRKYLGSSDLAILFAHLLKFPLPYKKTDVDIYWSKVNNLPNNSTLSTETGDWLEKPLLELAAKELGVDIIIDPGRLFTVAQHGPGKGLLAANHDSLIVGRRAGIEAKFRNADNAQFFGEPNTDQVALDVVVQTQTQMYCGDLDEVYVILGTPSYYTIEHRLYRVPRDEKIIDTIAIYGSQWWQEHIEAGVPPDGNLEPPLYVLKALERKIGVQIRLPDEAVEWCDKRIELKKNIKTLATEVETINRKLLHALGDAEIGLLANGGKVTFKQYMRKVFDDKRLRLELPEIAAEYTYETMTNTGIRISKPQK